MYCKASRMHWKSNPRPACSCRVNRLQSYWAHARLERFIAVIPNRNVPERIFYKGVIMKESGQFYFKSMVTKQQGIFPEQSCNPHTCSPIPKSVWCSQTHWKSTYLGCTQLCPELGVTTMGNYYWVTKGSYYWVSTHRIRLPFCFRGEPFFSVLATYSLFPWGKKEAGQQPKNWQQIHNAAGSSDITSTIQQVPATLA